MAGSFYCKKSESYESFASAFSRARRPSGLHVPLHLDQAPRPEQEGDGCPDTGLCGLADQGMAEAAPKQIKSPACVDQRVSA
jgi:hypothetical protein